MTTRDIGEDAGVISGERGASIVSRPSSVTSRLHSVLAVGVMSALGLGMLTWYYTHAAAKVRPGRTAPSMGSAQRDVPLPDLGNVDAPSPPPADLPQTPVSAGLSPLREVPLELSAPASPNGAMQARSPEQLARDRQLAGAVYSAQTAGSPMSPGALPASAPGVPGTQETGELSALLRSTSSDTAHPHTLPPSRLLLPKGAFIDCTLETAIDSTLPGITTCILATDTFSADGRVVLLERGTKLVGETRGQPQQGSSRIFVIWSEARTPDGVLVPLASPGADELGRSGLPGTAHRHFLQRFGAAMLISVIDGAVQGAVQSSRGGAVIVNPSGTEGVTTEALRSTVNIPPTVTKSQGDRIQVLVARDIDFRSVYELAPAASSR